LTLIFLHHDLAHLGQGGGGNLQILGVDGKQGIKFRFVVADILGTFRGHRHFVRAAAPQTQTQQQHYADDPRSNQNQQQTDRFHE